MPQTIPFPSVPHVLRNSIDHGGTKLVVTVAGRKRDSGTFLGGFRRQKMMSLLSVPKPLFVSYTVVVRGNLGFILFHQSHPLLPVNTVEKVKAGNGIYHEFSFPVFKYRKCDAIHSIRHSQYSRACICTSFCNWFLLLAFFIVK
ncbi:hypothetical protein AVEN_233493-1 [Araneus ventricosus]|uniref:Uncharacterized protein n=1 Tax=Araneus ventricosus TaxID=182803 RepID=A0A4Y2N9D7_ARAVE|nr:hypothetical protein AVEN_233493-1 [Araneus ventricosus]